MRGGAIFRRFQRVRQALAPPESHSGWVLREKCPAHGRRARSLLTELGASTTRRSSKSWMADTRALPRRRSSCVASELAGPLPSAVLPSTLSP
jgi:hypothetical protein